MNPTNLPSYHRLRNLLLRRRPHLHLLSPRARALDLDPPARPCRRRNLPDHTRREAMTGTEDVGRAEAVLDAVIHLEVVKTTIVVRLPQEATGRHLMQKIGQEREMGDLAGGVGGHGHARFHLQKKSFAQATTVRTKKDKGLIHIRNQNRNRG